MGWISREYFGVPGCRVEIRPDQPVQIYALTPENHRRLEAGDKWFWEKKWVDSTGAGWAMTFESSQHIWLVVWPLENAGGPPTHKVDFTFIPAPQPTVQNSEDYGGLCHTETTRPVGTRGALDEGDNYNKRTGIT